LTHNGHQLCQRQTQRSVGVTQVRENLKTTSQVAQSNLPYPAWFSLRCAAYTESCQTAIAATAQKRYEETP
jgi:hypothetical protein